MCYGSSPATADPAVGTNYRALGHDMQWFDVDKEGLASLIQRRGAASAVVELVQNALDTDANEVSISLEVTDPGLASLRVEDNDPNGFADLAHAFTLFAPSEKKYNPNKRGRFNLGEKLVLALCDVAEIKSTSGTIKFDENGRTENRRARRKAGSSFEAVIRLEQHDVDAVTDLVHRLLLPRSIKVSYNGEVLERRSPEASWRESLQTEVADDDGLLKARKRTTSLTLYRPREGETPHLYELGIPVVEIDGAFHVNVGQKVPLNMERNNVTPAYLRAVQLSVVNNATELLTEDQAASGWVTTALGSDKISDAAVLRILEAKFGTEIAKIVRYDPSDPQAHREAQSKGYTVVGGRTFTKDQWASIDRAGLVPAAGKITPSVDSQRMGREDGTIDPKITVIPEDELNEIEYGVVHYIRDFAQALIGKRVKVQVVKDSRSYGASYGTGRTPVLTLNRSRLHKAWWIDQHKVDELTLHELAHDTCDDHLSHDFYTVAFRLGAQSRLLEHRLADYVPVGVTLDSPAAALKVGID